MSHEESPVSAATLADRLPAGGVRPTIVLVHGAWADGASWSGVVEALQPSGLPVRAVANQIRDLGTDAEDLAAFLSLTPGPVVLVGHSYGGAVITNAASDPTQVRALVYIDAIAPEKGESNISLIGDASTLNADPSTLYDVVDYGGAPDGARESYLKHDVFLQHFASSVDPETAEWLWASQRGAADPAFNVAATHAAWTEIPSWFFVSTGDTIITQQAKNEMAQRAKATVITHEGGSHLTLVSDPVAVADVIAQVVVETLPAS
jgi:pimeloyl-ACP methyl ester carboxylesterase